MFDVPPKFYHVFREMFMEDFYNISNLKTVLKPGAIVFDVGANVGFFSFQLFANFPLIFIYAFEPMEENIAVFNKNVSLNRSLANRLVIEQAAVTGSYDGELEIYFDNKNQNSVIASLYKDFSTDNNASKIVKAKSLSSIIKDKNVERVDLLKLDCEGSEYSILYDSPPETFSVIRNIIIEVHDLDQSKRNKDSLISFLEDKNFKVKWTEEENHCYSLFAYK